MKSRLFVVAVGVKRLVVVFGIVLLLVVAPAPKPALAACNSGTVPAISGFVPIGTFTFAAGASVTITATHSDPALIVGIAVNGLPVAFATGVTAATVSGTGAPMLIEVGGTLPGTVSWTINDGTCGGGGSTWNPNDARVDPRPGDRIAVYCNTNTTGTNANTIGVYGILDDGQGKFLTAFKIADVRKAGGKGITRSVEPLGTVYISLSGTNSFYVKWMGGPADATGMGDFRKRFTCDFA